MKRNLLLVLVLCSFTALFSQDRSIVPWRDISEATGMDKNKSQYISDIYIPDKYIIGYHENGKLKYIWSTDFIRPVIHEDECIGTGPWEGNITISPSSMNYEIIAKEVLEPYYKIADSCSVHIAAFYDLSGNFLKFELEIPAEVNIPIKAIEELYSRLEKESKLKLEYDPEKAKYVNFITLSTIPLLIRGADDTYLKNEYEKTDSNTYVISYYDSEIFKETRSRHRKFISNINNPYEGIGTACWQGRIKILSASAYPDNIAEEVLAPYWKGVDWTNLYVRSFYDLNGDLQYFELGVPAEENIPVKVVEELENRLKKESKLKLEYNSERAKHVNYVRIP